MKISAFQMSTVYGDLDANLRKVEAWTDEVVEKERPDVLMLPEMWPTSFDYAAIAETASEDRSFYRNFLAGLAKKYHVNYAAGSIPEKQDGTVYNTAVAYDREGEEILCYRKVHLATVLHEERYLGAGNELPQVFELDGVKAGMAICYDLRFPELMRHLGAQGAKILFYCSAWPRVRADQWSALLRARAIENEAFVIGCGQTGMCGKIPMAGSSAVIDPMGTVLAQGTMDDEMTVTAVIDPERADAMRAMIRVYEDRRPDIYAKGLKAE